MSLALLFHYLLLNMFRMLIHPSSGACDLFVELFHGLYCSGMMQAEALVLQPASGYHTTPVKPQHNTNTHRTNYSTIKMMHGPINISNGFIPSRPCTPHGVHRKTLSLSGLLLNQNHDAFKWGQSAAHLSPSANATNSWSLTSTPPASIPLTSVPPPEVRSLLQIRHASVHPHSVIVQYGRVFVASWWKVAMAAGTGRPSARPNAG